MSTVSDEAKPEKREREETTVEATTEAVAAEEPPAAKKAKADGEAKVEVKATEPATETPTAMVEDPVKEDKVTAETTPEEPKVEEKVAEPAADEASAVVEAAAKDATKETAPVPAAVVADAAKPEEPKAAEAAEVQKTEAKVEEKKEEVASLTEEEAEAEALKMMEFYFDDSNFSWDRFMQSKAGKMGDKLMDASILLSFNKVKTIVKRAGLSDEDGLALVIRVCEASPNLRVSEDKKQIGRTTPMTEEGQEARIARTVQTKGYQKDSRINIEGVEKLFADVGKATYVKICKAGGRKLTSIFVEFDTQESADKAVEKSEQFTHEGDSITVRKASRPQDHGDKKREAKADDGEKVEAVERSPVEFVPGKIVHVAGIPKEGVSRESLRDGLNKFGTVKYVDFSFGELEAWIRMEEPSEAAAAVEGSKDGLKLGDVEEKGVVSALEGEVEKAYYERVEKMKAEKNGRSNRGRGRGRGRGGGRGRGKGGRGRK